MGRKAPLRDKGEYNDEQKAGSFDDPGWIWTE